jgi:hypothetical protein
MAAGGAAPAHSDEVAGVGAGASYDGFGGCRCWPKTKRKTRRTHWWGCDHETGVREGRKVEERRRVGQDNSNKESQPRRGGSEAR